MKSPRKARKVVWRGTAHRRAVEAMLAGRSMTVCVYKDFDGPIQTDLMRLEIREIRRAPKKGANRG